MAGRVQVRWETEGAATPMGQLAYFIEFLTLTGLWSRWRDSHPLSYVSPNAPSKADILGTWMLSLLSGHKRYALRWRQSGPFGQAQGDQRGRPAPGAVISPEVLRNLLDYPWPGNVRELENALEHALICAIDGVIRTESLPPDIRDYHGQGTLHANLALAVEGADSQLRGQILFALKRCEGNKAAAAKMLGIDRTTLWRRMRKLGLA